MQFQGVNQIDPTLDPREKSERVVAPRVTVALILTWPEIKNAEYEVIQRIVTALKNLNCGVLIVDNDGYVLWSSQSAVPQKKARIRVGDCDFVISFHFESPRLIDAFSYSALWNPIDFYFVFGYEKSVAKLVSHNDCLSCRSDIADAHALNLFQSLDRPVLTPLPALFHSLPQPYLEPRIDSKARGFYVGINWEKTQRTKGRHHDVLKILDDEDLVSLYGPEEFLGVRPWEGYKNYKGSISFDGRSILTHINEAGICFAFSSNAHQRSEIMSNRLFEGLAGGAVVIANKHAFIDRYFADCVYTVDDSVGPVEFADQVRNIVLEVRRNPAKARERARVGQKRLREAFSHEVCLTRLIEEHPRRVAHFERVVLGPHRHAVTVIMDYAGVDFEAFAAFAESVLIQKAVDLDVVLICDTSFADAYRSDIVALFRKRVRSLEVQSERFYEPSESFDRTPRRVRGSGPSVYEALKRVRTEFFAILRQEDAWFSDHLASLAHAMSKMPDSLFASSGLILEAIGPGERRSRAFEGLRFEAFPEIVHCHRAVGGGRFLYRDRLVERLPAHLFQLLDGQEQNVLNLCAYLGGPIAASNVATCVLHQDVAANRATPLFPLEQQHQFVRDAFVGNPEWRSLLGKVGGPPAFVFAYAPGAGIQWENYRTPVNATAVLEPNRMYDVRAGGEGTRFLGPGFSHPESSFTWVQGDRGELDFKMTLPPGAFELVMVLGGGKPRSGDQQPVTVTLNGFALGYIQVPETLTRISFLLNPKLYRGVETFRLGLEPADASHPTDAEGVAVDPRRLGVRIASFGVIETGLPTLEPDRVYEIREGGEGVQFISAGFSVPEAHGTWIDGSSGQLAFRVPSQQDDLLDLTLKVAGRRARPDGPDPEVTITLNGEEVDRFRAPAQGVERRVPVPPSRHHAVESVRLDISVDPAEPVRDESGRVIDPRHLGVSVQSFGLVRPDLPVIERGRTYSLAANGDGTALMWQGFSEPEPGFTWIDGDRAHLRFRIEPPMKDLELVFVAAGRPAQKSGEPQHVTVRVNQRIAGSYTVPEAETSIAVPLDADLYGTSAFLVELILDHAEPVIGWKGALLDKRRLGLYLKELGLREAQRPVLALNRMHDLAHGESGAPFVRWPALPKGGDALDVGPAGAELAFRLEKPAPAGLDLALELGDGSGEGGDLVVNVNAVEAGRVRIAGSTLRMALPEQACRGEDRFRLNIIADPEPASDAPDAASSPRLSVLRFGVFEPKG